jgi:Fe2+ transport system protein B
MLFEAHSGLRYLVLLSGLVVIGYAVFGAVTGRAYDRRMRILAAVFTGLIDLTALFGVAHLFTGTFYPQLGGHIVTMVLAVAVAHIVSVVMKRRVPEQRTYTPHIVGTAVVLALIAVGIMAIGRPIVG